MADPSGEEPRLRTWMSDYQRGQMQAFERLYEALAPSLGQYLGALSRDSVRAADLLQETFLQLHRSRHTYSPAHPVRPWAFAIARHVFLMESRSRRRRGAHESPAAEALPELPVPPEVEGLASREQLGRALERLPQERREALLMHHLWGLSFREIAEVLGIREGAARLRASRAMAALRRELGPAQEEAWRA